MTGVLEKYELDYACLVFLKEFLRWKNIVKLSS